jgi:hypothetical protein
MKLRINTYIQKENLTTDGTDFADEEGILNKKSVFADLRSDVWSTFP